MKVVLLAGGLGSRVAEETVRIPKPMVEVGGRPIILPSGSDTRTGSYSPVTGLVAQPVVKPTT